MEKRTLTQDYLKSILHYNPDTGIFTWKLSKGRRVKENQIAGCINNKNDYIDIQIDNESYKAHRLAFLYMNGDIPNIKVQVDHINHIRTDNSWNNLRIVNNTINQQNRTLNLNNKSGFLGVNWHKCSNKWVAQIQYEGKKIHLGTFIKLEDAILARKDANIKYGFHENNGSLRSKKKFAPS